MNLKLRELREAHNLSVKQMIQRLGIQDSRYRKWESQAAAIPLEYACMCCDIFHCSLDELAGRKTPDTYRLAPDEEELIGLYRDCDARGKNAIMRNAVGEAGVEREFADGQIARTA